MVEGGSDGQIYIYSNMILCICVSNYLKTSFTEPPLTTIPGSSSCLFLVHFLLKILITISYHATVDGNDVK